MRFLAFHFVGGDAFFSGVVLLLSGLIVACWRGGPGQRFTVRLTTLLGAVLVAFSSTPLPQWFYAIWLFVLIAWLTLENRRATNSHNSHAERTFWLRMRKTFWLWPTGTDHRVVRPFRAIGSKRAVRTFHVAMAAVTLAAASWEILWRAAQSLDRHSFSTMYVIGDSLSAGMLGSQELTWPRELQQSRDIEVIDLSRAGATTRSALAQADLIDRGEVVVLIEIGGNDLLGEIGSEQFAADLDALLNRLLQPGRQLVMLELPLPPFYNQYGRIQRTVARKYNVTLIPRRFLAGVIFAEDATIDGLHLSARGHRLLSQMIWEHVASAFQEHPAATVPQQLEQ
jgi:acyl-CoA thioesterase-1